MATETAQAPVKRSLHVHGLMLAASKRNSYRVVTSIGDAADDLLSPSYWVHVSRQMRVDDRIEVMAFDRSWFGELTVLEVGAGGHGGARVAWLIAPVRLDNKATIDKPAEFEPRWNGSAKWSVVRVKDGQVLTRMLETKEDAVAWIEANAKQA